MKFSSQASDPVQGNDLCFRMFGRDAVRQHKQFKAFFTVQDPAKISPDRKQRPTYKVDPIIKHLQEVSMRAWRLGRDISGDEQTIGFQGRHADKLRITYKAEGDGFQCDAICDAGYTWTFFFRNMPAPQKWIRLGYLPLHSQILAMFDQLEEKTIIVGLIIFIYPPSLQKHLSRTRTRCASLDLRGRVGGDCPSVFCKKRRHPHRKSVKFVEQ